MRDVSSAFVSRTRGTRAEHLRRRSAIVTVAAVLSLSVTAPAAAQQPWARAPRDSAARDTNRVSIDSLVARLERTEQALELLKQELATEASSNVRTRSRLQTDLWARVLMNGFMSRGQLNNTDVPTYATNTPFPNGDLARSADGLSKRQTRNWFSLFVDSVAGGAFEGDFDADFFGGGEAGPTNEYKLPEPRLRTAKFIMHWPRTELLVGGETPLISDMNPVTVASVGVPGFSEAGNLWNWLPQVRLTRDVGTTKLAKASMHWALQGAVLHPFSGFDLGGGEGGVDAGVRSGRPYLESRLRARWGADASPAGAGPGDAGGEIGFGVHRGWIRNVDDRLASSDALSIDARIGLPFSLELRGEAYDGQALAGLGGGGIDQNFGIPTTAAPLGTPLRDVGGWGQLNWKAHPAVITGVGCGLDVPRAADLPERRRNLACAEHVMWRPAQPLVFGVELRQLRTTYESQVLRGTHLNFSFGFEL
jgi:hypothetical protein